jgi:hypothetical protein
LDDRVEPDEAPLFLFWLTDREKMYEMVCNRFKEIYGSLYLLEKRIEEDGVPTDDHTLWDDAIEWRNTVSSGAIGWSHRMNHTTLQHNYNIT